MIQGPSGGGLRDVFLSHRSTTKHVVRRLANDLGKQQLSTWVDEGEIRPGQSIPGAINQGLENSRYIGLVLTPDYFDSPSGWTDAEWHAALHTDPDNRKARLIPLLVEDCPYIPILLRHLRLIDLRGRRYQQGLRELVSVLKDDQVPRPITHRGQLVSLDRVDRATIIAERAVIDGNPDPVNERWFCNLLPVERLPRHIYVAPLADGVKRTRRDGSLAVPSKQELIALVRQAQVDAGVERPITPAFRQVEDSIVTFHDLEDSDSPLACLISDTEVDCLPIEDFMTGEDDRRLVTSLLNMAISRHANRVGLVPDATKQGRFYFPPKDGGPNVRTWRPLKNIATRIVAKPCFKDGNLLFWRHLGAYLKMVFLANRYYLQVIPTWVITNDGVTVRGGPGVGRLVIKWTGPERNLNLLYHVRFWTMTLRLGRGPISVRAGDQSLDLSPVPAFIEQSYGIAGDRRDLLQTLDQEASAIAEQEDLEVDQHIEAELAAIESGQDDSEGMESEEQVNDEPEDDK